jgi:hypothetical protein
MKRFRLWLLLSSILPALAAAAAPPVAVVTIVETFTLVIRDASKLALAEGERLQAGDIVETTPQASLVRLELNDGSLIDLGPGTRVMLTPDLAGAKPKPNTKPETKPDPRARRSPLVYVLQGWVKLTAPPATPEDKLQITLPGIEVSGVTGRVVLLVLPGTLQAFAEAGPVNAAEVATGAVTKLATGGFVSRQGADKPVALPRPPGDFIQRVPRAFIDSLPARAERFKGRDVAPKSLGTISHADVQPWLTAEPALRARFLTQWRAQAQVPAFRQGLLADLKLHPEWDRILNPEKYKPKPTPPPPAKPALKPVYAPS